MGDIAGSLPRQARWNMAAETFVYVTYIRTTVEKLWEALTEPQFTRRYWSGIHQESDWRPGSSWALKSSDGDLWDSGQVLEIERPRRLVVSWRNEAFEWAHAIGFTRCTFELAPQGETVKLTITHEVPAGENSSTVCSPGVGKRWASFACSST